MLVRVSNERGFKIKRVFIEPVGSVVPKLTAGDKIRTVDKRVTLALTMLCPMQAFPVPSYR